MSKWRTPLLYIEFGTQSLNGNAVIPAAFNDARCRLLNAGIDTPLKVGIVVVNTLPFLYQRVHIGRLLNIDIEA